MRSGFYLTLLLVYTAICRLFLINSIPLLINSSLNSRFFSVLASVGSMFILFFISKNYFKSQKIALLSTWFFANLPWVFEQGRIVSQPNIALFFILMLFLFIQKGRTRFKYIFLLVIFPILYFAYPQFWLFNLHGLRLSNDSFLTNLFILLSFDLLFFKNITFWWGGIREFGILFLSFLPFFISGIYFSLIQKRYKLSILLLLAILIASVSPFFPESREFYFSTPIISGVLSFGIYRWLNQKNIIAKTIFICIFIFMMYEFSQFFHFYFVHYPQQVISNSFQIHEAF